MKRVVLVLAVTAVMLSANGLWAEDVSPPVWRGDPGSTMQVWEFSDDSNPALPDVSQNSNGTADVSLTGGFLENTVWYADYQGASGVWGYEQEMIASIPNFDNQNPLKEVWVQVTYIADFVPNIFALPDGDQGNIIVMDLVDDIAGTGDYSTAVYHATIVPNPTFEEIWIRPSECTTYIDELVVDTICIPEPATMCLLGLGALALLRKRRP